MAIVHWVRFRHGGETCFGTLSGERVAPYGGDMFGTPQASGEVLRLAEVELLTPTQPTKMVGLWNNYRALAAKLDLAVPAEPLYFLKAPSSLLAPGATIRRPAGYAGKVVFEGELGVVIGRSCSNVSVEQAPDCIFGFTCVNDVTAVDIIGKDPAFPQWDRAKGFDTFGPIGPVIATGLDPLELVVQTLLNGEERQRYAVSDIVFTPARLVAAISATMTLHPGDVIACGTSVGAGSMKPGSRIDIRIDGIGTLSNVFE